MATARFQVVCVDDEDGLVDGVYVGPAFFATDDLDGWKLVAAHGAVATAGTGVAVMVQNNGTPMLTDRIEIDSGHTTSYTAATPPAPDPFANEVSTGDKMLFYVIDGGSGVLGLNVFLTFESPPEVLTYTPPPSPPSWADVDAEGVSIALEVDTHDQPIWTRLDDPAA